MVVERVRLYEIDDVELVALVLSRICYPEVVPLGQDHRRSVVLLKL